MDPAYHVESYSAWVRAANSGLKLYDQVLSVDSTSPKYLTVLRWEMTPVWVRILIGWAALGQRTGFPSDFPEKYCHYI